jgi:UDP-perosamine 4-acetyltransferase
MADAKGIMRCVVIGAGGHAGVLVETLRLIYPGIELVALDPKRAGEEFFGVKIIGSDELIVKLKSEGFGSFVAAVGSVGASPEGGFTRKRVFENGINAGLLPLSVVHPGAAVAPSAQVGAGFQCLAGGIVATNVKLGDNVLVNHGAIVDHDCKVGSHSHVATGAKLAGGVTLEECVHVGIGASVIQGCRVRAFATVGAGAVVVRDVERGATVVGVPARAIKHGES